MVADAAKRPSRARRAANRVSTLVTDQNAARPAVNVGQTERWASIAGGGALAVYGLSRGTWLGLALAGLGGGLLYRGLSGHCHLYDALDLSTADEHRNPRVSVPAGQGVRVDESITIDRPAEELFRFWRDFTNLPRVMRHVKSVTNIHNQRSHWLVMGPAGIDVEWDAEIVMERPNELIAWRSLHGAEVASAGSVHFRRAPGNRGTEVRVVLKYEPPAGKLGAWAAWLAGRAPEQEIQEGLLRLKSTLEAGEAPSVEGQPRGQCC